ncbi:MAG: restriction endonuclease [Bacteroidia bacterium]
MDKDLDERLTVILAKYKSNFEAKEQNEEEGKSDLLMEIFGITPEQKVENRQYWGRELGMCWQLMVKELFQIKREDFIDAKKFGADEPADLFIGKDAIDVKYRMGSGDSGTIKKWKQYAHLLTTEGYQPIILLLRSDNLPSAINACKVAGWTVLQEEESFEYIQTETNFDLKAWMITQIKSKQFNLFQNDDARN